MFEGLNVGGKRIYVVHVVHVVYVVQPGSEEEKILTAEAQRQKSLSVWRSLRVWMAPRPQRAGRDFNRGGAEAQRPLDKYAQRWQWLFLWIPSFWKYEPASRFVTGCITFCNIWWLSCINPKPIEQKMLHNEISMWCSYFPETYKTFKIRWFWSCNVIPAKV